jgi:hypothetical protein
MANSTDRAGSLWYAGLAHVAGVRAWARLAGRDLGQLVVRGQLARDRRVVVVERRLAAQLGLGGRAGDRVTRRRGEEEHDDVGRDQGVGDPGGPPQRVLIVDREYHTSSLS